MYFSPDAALAAERDFIRPLFSSDVTLGVAACWIMTPEHSCLCTFLPFRSVMHNHDRAVSERVKHAFIITHSHTHSHRGAWGGWGHCHQPSVNQDTHTHTPQAKLLLEVEECKTCVLRCVEVWAHEIHILNNFTFKKSTNRWTLASKAVVWWERWSWWRRVGWCFLYSCTYCPKVKRLTLHLAGESDRDVFWWWRCEA